jgi:hypothetical protein
VLTTLSSLTEGAKSLKGVSLMFRTLFYSPYTETFDLFKTCLVLGCFFIVGVLAYVLAYAVYDSKRIAGIREKEYPIGKTVLIGDVKATVIGYPGRVEKVNLLLGKGLVVEAYRKDLEGLTVEKGQ